MWTHFDYQQLNHFLAVAKASNLTRAASTLHISQPALSRSIQKLEEKVGSPLFERLPRGMKLTSTGALLKARANEIKQLIDNTLSELHEANNLMPVRLAVIPTIAPYLLPRLLREFTQAHTDIKIEIHEDTTENIIRRCKEGEIDIALVALPIQDKDLQLEPLFQDELLLVFPKGHSLAKKKKISLTDIQEFPFISLNEQHCLSDNIAEYCSRKSITPITIERTDQLATIQELVSLKHGISILPKMAAELDTTKQRVYQSFTGKKPFRTIALLQNSARYKHPSVQLFENYLKLAVT